MSTFKPYLVKAALGGVELLVQSVSREYSWRISKHQTPGTKGDETQHHGRNSIVDSVTALVTVPEAKKLRDLGESTRVHLWTHPLLDPIIGRIENLSVPADAGLYGYLLVSFNVVEHREPKSSAGVRPTLSAKGVKNQLTSIFEDMQADFDGLDDIPGQTGATFTAAWAGVSDSWSDMSDTFDQVDNAIGTWRDIARTLDAFTDAADDFIDAIYDVADDVEAIGNNLISASRLIVQITRDAVDDIKSAPQRTVTFYTQAPSDLYAMMADAGIAITENNILAIMLDNGLDDPLAILPGVQITIPVAV